MHGQRSSADGDYLAGLLLEQLQVHALITLDVNGTIVGWFGGAERILGYTAEEAIGQNISIIFTQEDLEKGASALELEMAKSSGEAEDDRWQVRKDGGKIWVSGAASPLKDADGQLVGYAKVLRNRTDSKTHIEALEKGLKNLEEANERKNSFISRLAHDLRNPLSSIATATGLIETVHADSLTEKRPFDVVRRQIAFMDQMISDLMEATRVSAGKVELHKQHLVLQELLRQAVEVCSPSAKEQMHDLQVLVPEAPIRVLVDPTRMLQVFVNLIANAIKYTPRNGTIWVKSTIDGEDIVVKVQDTGIGIAPELMPNIFDLFTQAESGTGAQGGLGIGLSVVKEIVTLHDGTVQALSDGIGKGSQFIVRFPAAEPRSHTPEPEHGHQ